MAEAILIRGHRVLLHHQKDADDLDKSMVVIEHPVTETIESSHNVMGEVEASSTPFHNAANGTDLRDVFDPAENTNASYPLNSPWTLYFTPPSRGQNNTWMDMVKEVATVDKVETFWSLFKNVPAPADLSIGSSYYLFRKNIQPQWEDVQNKDGGKWELNLPRDELARMNEAWLHTVRFLHAVFLLLLSIYL